MGVCIISQPNFQRPSGKLYLLTPMTNLINNTATRVLLDTIPPDFKDGIEDIVNHRITPGKAGLYLVNSRAYFDLAAADTVYKIEVRENGNVISSDHQQCSIANGEVTCEINFLCHLAHDSYLELWATSVSGNDDVGLHGGPIQVTALSVQRVR